MRDLISDFEYVKEGIYDYDGKRLSYKNIMVQYGIDYNPTKCHKLKVWAEQADEDSPEDVAEYLTITTGKKWAVSSAYGYCQGDYVEMVYCTEHYDDVRPYGEVFLGAAKEFCVIDLDDDGNEQDSVYGFVVADCQARTDEDYKRLVCEWYGCDEDEAQLEIISGWHTYTTYDYRIA